MKRDKRLIILKNSSSTKGSVTFLRDGTRCSARFSFLKNESGIVVVLSEKETSSAFLDCAYASVEFDCGENIVPYFYAVTESGVIYGSWDGRAMQKIKEIERKYAQCTQREKNENKTDTPCENIPISNEAVQTYDDEEIASTNFYPSNVACILGEQNEEEECAMTVAENSKRLRNFSLKLEAESKEDKVRCVGGRRANYYEKAQGKIELLFKKFERFETLEKLLPESRWVKIPYDNGGRFYAVGVVGVKPEYVCYAVPDVYKSVPPPAFEDVGVWITSDAKGGKEAGFWVVYQGCKEGKLNAHGINLLK